jgi:hypothetical protein
MKNDSNKDHGRDVDPADPVSLAQSRDRAASQLRHALRQLTRQGFSPSHPVGEVVYEEFSLLASAVRTTRESTYEVTISVNCHPEPLDTLHGLTLDLLVKPDLHFLALIDEAGSASFSGLQDAEWEIWSLGRPGATGIRHGFAMPSLERSGALAASSVTDLDVKSFTRQVHSPDGGAVFTVRTPPGEKATLEIDFSTATRHVTPFLVPVAYRTSSEDEAVLLAAVARHRQRLYTAMTLTGFNPYGEWSVGEPFDPSLLSRWPAAVITESVMAARTYHQAEEFWLRIAELAPSSSADVVRNAID